MKQLTISKTALSSTNLYIGIRYSKINSKKKYVIFTHARLSKKVKARVRRKLNYFNFSLLASKDDKLKHLARSVLFPIFIENRCIRTKFALLCGYEITRVTAKDFNIMKLDFEFHPIHAIKTIPSAEWAPEDPLGYRFRGLIHHILNHTYFQKLITYT